MKEEKEREEAHCIVVRKNCEVEISKKKPIPKLPVQYNDANIGINICINILFFTVTFVLISYFLLVCICTKTNYNKGYTLALLQIR
jgi:hypothetical protein